MKTKIQYIKLMGHSERCAAAAKSLQSCPTLRPHRRQPTRLCRPWDSPGKSTGVVCHCLLRKLQHFHNKGAMMPVAENYKE